MQSCMWSPRQYTVHFTVVSHSFCYVMRSESYTKGVETLHCEPTAIRWGRKTGTDHIRTGVQEVISCISHISGTNSVTNVTAALFTPYNISGWSFFFWLCTTKPICGSHTLSCQTVMCLFSACQEGELTFAWCYHEYITSPQQFDLFWFSSAAIHSEKEQKLWFTVVYLLGCIVWG